MNRQPAFDEHGVYQGEYDGGPKDYDDPRVCQLCVRTNGSYRPSHAYTILNSRTGKYHSGNYGRTECGQDATKDWFVWPI